MSSSPAPIATPGGRNLADRWNRAFLLLAAVIVVTALVGFLATRTLVGTLHDAAVEVEQVATTNAELRADVVAHAVVFANEVTIEQWRTVERTQEDVRSTFSRAVREERAVDAVAVLETAHRAWEAIVATGGPPGEPASAAVRGLAVSTLAPEVLVLLDEAGAVSRAAARDGLADATRLDRLFMAALFLLDLVAVALAVRLARRLRTEVLRPVGILRRSANELAAGNLDHRVVVDRVDELGELAVSFNAMADAVAGSQRSLTAEATTDHLSGLANRAAFRRRLEGALARPGRRDGEVAVLFVDLDDFKDVNDTLGHAAGDEVLRVVAGRLRGAVRPGDLVARFGGDEFALLLDGVPDRGTAAAVADRVVASMEEQVRVGDGRANVGASVGMAMSHLDSTFDGLMREADVAMYAAKGKGKHRVERYDAGIGDAAAARLRLKADVLVAAERGELVVDYQPVADLDTGALVGMEALVRWQHPTRGLLPPSDFIGLAEETGAIVALGASVLDTAATHAVRWQRRFGRPDLWVSVNVSMRQLDLPGFATEVREVLRSTGLDPTTLVLEVTESVLAEAHGGAAASLAELRRIGVRVALDDFGTGFSSIGYLRQLPVDVLKIDRSFVSGPGATGTGLPLLGAIVAMGQRLGLEVLPEGIEEPEQLACVRHLGCHVGQGFLLSRPAGPDAIEALLASALPFPEVGLAAAGSRTSDGSSPAATPVPQP